MNVLLQDYRYYDIASVVFKITDKCNLHCDYCYRENAPTLEKKHMSLDIIDKTLNSVFEYKTWLYSSNRLYCKQPSVNFIWHGGEPLLAGKEKIYEILKMQARYVNAGLKIQNAIQTNATLIDQSIATIFKEKKFRVGVSIDGPKKIQDIHRRTIGDHSSFEKTVKGIRILKDHKIPWSSIAVLSKETVEYIDDIYLFFKTEGAVEVDFIPSFFYESDFTLSPESYAKVMIRLFDIWVSDKNPSFTIRFFKDVLYMLGYWKQEKEVIICELAGKCHRNISIMTNGDFYTCECLNAKPSNKVGNITNQSILDITFSEPFINMTINTNLYHDLCSKCDVFNLCKAGCYNRRLPVKHNSPAIDFYCSARKKIFNHIKKYVNSNTSE